MEIEGIKTKADLEKLIDKRIEQTPMNKIRELPGLIADIHRRLTKGGL